MRARRHPSSLGRCRRCVRGDPGVSDVLASLLLLSVTVAFAAGFGALIANLPPPLATDRAVLASFVLPTAPSRLVVEHRGGVHVPLRDLVVVVDLDSSRTSYNVGERLAAGDPAWSVVAADGASRGANASFRPGDQVRFTDAALQGPTLRVAVADRGANLLLYGMVALRESDTVAPSLAAARTTSTTTIEVTLSESLQAVLASDFTVSGSGVTGARLLGDGRVVELVTTAFATNATPTVATIPVPTGTRDLGNNLVAAGQSTTAVDRTPPTIAGVSDGASASQVWVNFTTSEPATPTVRFGPTLLYGLTATAAAGTVHSVVLGSLTSGTTYHYQVTAEDAAGNENDEGADRAKATTGGGGAGGSSAATNHIEFTTAPATLDQGIASTTMTITHRNSDGQATNPTSALTVHLATNSTAGHFLDASTSAVISSVTISTSGSTATFKYVDARPGGPSVLTAGATNTIPGSAVVSVTRRGLVPSHGDSAASLVVRVVYPAEQDRDEANVLIGLSVMNPTPTARTVASVSLASSPSLGTGTSSFFRSTLAVAAGSDTEFAGCTLTGADSNTATCDPADFTLPAYALRQLVLQFRTSNRGTDTSTSITGSVTLAGGAGTVSSPGVPVRHEGAGGQATMVRVMGAASAGGNRIAAFASGVTGGSPSELRFAWNFDEAGGTSSTRIHIPAGWRDVSVPTGQAILNTVSVTIHQPTEEEEGYVLVGSEGPADDTARDLAIRATPPAFSGLDVVHVDYEANPSADINLLVSTFDFGVRIA